MKKFAVEDVLASYNRLAGEIVPDYESLAFEEIHPAALDLLPPAPAVILDVGAGTGRDAAWLARHGHEVVAVEPSRELRLAGHELHDSSAITWIDDCLPELSLVCESGSAFDLIWLSAMWMHVPPDDRARAFRTLASLLKPTSSMMFSLRLGPLPPERPMAPVSADEIVELARGLGLEVVRTSHHADAAGRPEISWDMVFVRGTSAR